MKQISLKVMKHSAIIALEVLGALIAVFFVAALVLFWRMSEGPVSAEFAVSYIEDALSRPEQNITAHIGDARLNWPNIRAPLVVEITDFSLTGEADAPIAALAKLGVELSKDSLLSGSLSVTGLTVYGPQLRILRTQSGRLDVDFLEGGAQNGAVPLSPPEEDQAGTGPENDTGPETDTGPEDTTDRDKLAEELLAGLLAEPRPDRLPDSLRRIEIRDAVMVYEDPAHALLIRAPQADMVVSRHTSGLDATLKLALARNGNTPSMTAHLVYVRADDTINVTASVEGFSPPAWADALPQLTPLSNIDMPIRMDVTAATDIRLGPGEITILAEGGAGALNLPGLYPAPVQIQGISARTVITPGNGPGHGKVDISDVTIDLGGPGALLDATLTRADGRVSIAGKALVTDMPVDDLHTYWPPAIAPVAWNWVTTHLSGGTAKQATLDIALSLPEAVLAGEKAEKGDITIDRLGGEISYAGVTVDYLPPLEKVHTVNGTARYDRSSFNLNIANGKAADMTLESAQIEITDLDKKPARIDIRLHVDGPLTTALSIINNKPLELPAKLGIAPDKINGRAKGKVTIGFPLIGHKLTPENVAVTADATLSDVKIDGLFAGLVVTGGPLDLSVDNDSLTVTGTADIEGRTAEISWLRHFTTDAEFVSRVEASLLLDAGLRAQFGHSGAPWLEGDLPARIKLLEFADKTKDVLISGDLAQAALAFEPLRFEKPVGAPGRLEATARLKNNRLHQIDIHKLTAENLDVAGKIVLNAPADTSKPISFNYAEMDPFVMGGTNAGLHVTANAAEQSLTLKLKGQSLDASHFLSPGDAEKSAAGGEKPETGPKPATPLGIFAEVDHLLTSDDTDLTSVRMFLRRDMFSRLDQLELDALTMDAASGNTKDLYVRFLPTGDGGHSLHIEAGDAGAALRALNISKSVRGGTIFAKGQPAKNHACNINGVVRMKNFTIVNLPALARLLNAMSLTGIEDLLGGKGIRFKSMKSDFRWIAEPDKQDAALAATLCKGGGEGKFVFSDGKTSGASLGLTFDGGYDFDTSAINLNGTIVPASQVNTFFSNIPVIGEALSGGQGSAVFAATYEIKGPAGEPKVTVNPLAALAPGFLRKLFFEGGFEGDEETTTPPDEN